jgi:hypothetical protein
VRSHVRMPMTGPRGASKLSLAAGVAASALMLGALAGPATASSGKSARAQVTSNASRTVPAGLTDGSGNFTFTTLNNSHDPTFNQLLGINNHGLIAGYYGSGASGHPNKGYTLGPPYGQANYVAENYPGSVQTQVTGLNNDGRTVGFWANSGGTNFGWAAINGRFTTANFTFGGGATNTMDQLLGVNDNGIAVGFAVNNSGAQVAYQYNTITNTASRVTVPAGYANPAATAISNDGAIVGTGTVKSGQVVSFLDPINGGHFELAVPGANSTTAFGVNDGDEVVGSYAVGTASHGFIWAPGFGFLDVDDPSGIGATALNGVNDEGQVVGFYTDGAGNTDGLLGNPK